MSLSLKPPALISRLKAGHESGFIILIVHVFRPSSVKYNSGHLCLIDYFPFVGVASNVSMLMRHENKVIYMKRQIQTKIR